jgi:hypothetical protein
MKPWVSLAVLAVLSGVAWRVEVEAHGWVGLTWAGYFHWAVPAAIVAFLAWVAWWIDAPTPRHRLAAVGALAAYAAAAAPATEQSLRMTFGLWLAPPGFVILLFGWWLLAPTTVAGLLVLCRAAPGWRRWAASQALFVAAVPFACALIEVLPQHGEHDLLHTLKSGLLVPPLVLALGVGVPTRR